MLKNLFRSLLLSVSLIVPAVAGYGEVLNREYQLKTAYLLHFAELAEWPKPGNFTICLQGNSPLREYLPILNGQQIDGYAVKIHPDTPFAIEECQILFFSDLQSLTQSVLEQAFKYHVLLVSDEDAFASQGGMIQFTLRDNKLKLIVNLNSVRQAGLKLSSKLLRMAEVME